MFNLKKACIGFAVGLLLSIIGGIAGNVSFGAVLVRALISGLCCGALTIGADYIFKKYFLDSDVLSDASTKQQSNSTSSSGAVDITVGDDELPDNATDPSFVLDSDVKPLSIKPRVAVSQEDSGAFKPASLGGVAASGDIGSGQASNSDDSGGQSLGMLDVENSHNDSDVMPEIDDLNVDEYNHSSDRYSDDDDIVSDSVFAETGKTKPGVSSGSENMGDAANIAAAIRTVLARDG
ncbi:MAG: hypothetical protein R3Y36_02060 [Spirochaetales bacterium]